MFSDKGLGLWGDHGELVILEPFSCRRRQQLWQMILVLVQQLFSRVESHFSGLSSRTAYKRSWKSEPRSKILYNVSIWPNNLCCSWWWPNTWVHSLRLTMIWLLRDEDKDWSWRLQMWSWWTPASSRWTPFPSLTTFVGTHVGDERYVAARYNCSNPSMYCRKWLENWNQWFLSIAQCLS